MAYEQKDNTGALFGNDKDGNDKRPDYTGDAMVNGAKMRVSAWAKISKSGNAYLSLKFSEPRGDAREDRPKRLASAGADPDDSPF